MPAPVYCTKIASRLARTYTDKHGLKDLVRELLGIDLSKQQQLPTGAPRRSATRRWPMQPRTCCICMRSGISSMPCWRARGARELAERLFPFPARPRPARSCRLGRRGHLRPFLRHVWQAGIFAMRTDRDHAAPGPHLGATIGRRTGYDAQGDRLILLSGGIAGDDTLDRFFRHRAARQRASLPRAGRTRRARVPRGVRHSRHVRILRIAIPAAVVVARGRRSRIPCRAQAVARAVEAARSISVPWSSPAPRS